MERFADFLSPGERVRATSFSKGSNFTEFLKFFLSRMILMSITTFMQFLEQFADPSRPEEGVRMAGIMHGSNAIKDMDMDELNRVSECVR